MFVTFLFITFTDLNRFSKHFLLLDTALGLNCQQSSYYRALNATPRLIKLSFHFFRHSCYKKNFFLLTFVDPAVEIE